MASDVGQKYVSDYVKTGWDYVKHLMALAHCGSSKPRSECYKDDMEGREMVVTFMKDYYGNYSTIFISLNGSPPKAYAILKPSDSDNFELRKVNGELKAHYGGETKEEIEIYLIKVLRYDLSVYKTIVGTREPVIRLSLKELLSRNDVIIMNTDILPYPNRSPLVQGRDFKILGWVLLTKNGELKSNGVDDVEAKNGYIIYNKTKYPPGLYYLIRLDGMKLLVDARHLETLLYDESRSD
jgi:hypothetical protein